MSDSFHGRNTVLLQTRFILEKTLTCSMKSETLNSPTLSPNFTLAMARYWTDSIGWPTSLKSARGGRLGSW